MTSLGAVADAARGIGGEHLVEELVGHAALDEFVLGEHSVAVFVHLGEDLLRPLLRRVVRRRRAVGRVPSARSHHRIDCLHDIIHTSLHAQFTTQRS